MRLAFSLPTDDAVHTYCVSCQSENPIHTKIRGLDSYICETCGHAATRAIIIDPEVEYWLSPSATYWHRIAGICVVNNDGKWLFFNRSRHPFGYTIPAGHVNRYNERVENPIVSAQRELQEETGISSKVSQLVPIETLNIVGDECRRGCDNHLWHIYAIRVPSSAEVQVQETEGSKPIWLTPAEALSEELTFATRHVLERCSIKVGQKLA
ncbi:MAG: NUDIX hydrolase [Candidatus Woesebacteria bacterium]|jgi:ADP-ribose pyrophosphatase YjhB (NUDIX family)